LVYIEIAEIVDRLKRRCMLRPQCLLVALERPLVHDPGVTELALSPIEVAEIVDRIQSR